MVKEYIAFEINLIRFGSFPGHPGAGGSAERNIREFRANLYKVAVQTDNSLFRWVLA